MVFSLDTVGKYFNQVFDSWGMCKMKKLFQKVVTLLDWFHSVLLLFLLGIGIMFGVQGYFYVIVRCFLLVGVLIYIDMRIGKDYD